MNSQPTIKNIEAMLKEEGRWKRAWAEKMLKSLGPCGIAKGQWPGICGRTGKARITDDGTTRIVVYRCGEHS